MICCYLILDLVRASERVLQLVTTADSRTVGPAEMAAGERRKGTALVGQPGAADGRIMMIMLLRAGHYKK